MKEDKIPDIGILCSTNSFTEEELKELAQDCENIGLEVEVAVRPSMPLASIDILVPNIEVFLSSEFVRGILIGVAANAVFELIESMIKKIWKKAQEKKLYKVTSTSITPQDPQIHIHSGKLSAILPTKCNDDVIDQYLDDLLRYIKKVKSKENGDHLYAVLDEETNELEVLSYHDLIEKMH